MKRLFYYLSVISATTSQILASSSAQSAVDGLLQKKQGISDYIVEIVGVSGADQPASWVVVTQGREGSTAYLVSDAKLKAKETRVKAGLTAFSLRKWKYDSTHAFTIAEKAARKAGVGFDSVCYRLSNQKGEPSWQIALVDRAGQWAGEVTLSAQTGKVTQQRYLATALAKRAPQLAQKSQSKFSKKTTGGENSHPAQNVAPAPPTANKKPAGSLAGLFGRIFSPAHASHQQPSFYNPNANLGHQSNLGMTAMP